MILDGREVALGPNNDAVLHALVLRRGREISRKALIDVLPEDCLFNADPEKALKNALWKLRAHGFDIPKGRRPVVLRESSGKGERPKLSVDLWDFLDHAAEGRYQKAGELVRGGRRPKMLEGDADHNKLFKEMLEEFEARENEVAGVLARRYRAIDLMRDERSRFLNRTLVPGVGDQVPIGKVRERLEPINFPWRSLQPVGELESEPLGGRLKELLEAGASSASPQHLILVGGHGSGKTLAAIGAYLSLTDRIDSPLAAIEMRPVFYFDGHVDGTDPEFGTNKWFKRRLEEVEAAGHGRPIVIFAHADAFFSRSRRQLDTILGWQMFRDCDVLLCCSEQFYFRHLRYPDYGRPVFGLERWDAEMQGRYASVLLGEKACADFEAWRDEDPTGTRQALSDLPLHLTFLFPMVLRDPEARERISVRWHLLDQVARMRLTAARQGADENELFNELAAVAHRFYTDDMAPGRPLGFNLDALRDFLRSRNPKGIEKRLDAIVNDSLITVPSLASDEYHFEKPVWGWFFIACHVAQILKRELPPDPADKALAKAFSPEVMGFCEEMLREEFALHEDRIVESLTSVAGDGLGKDLADPRDRTAQAQARQLLERLRPACPLLDAAEWSRTITSR